VLAVRSRTPGGLGAAAPADEAAVPMATAAQAPRTEAASDSLKTIETRCMAESPDLPHLPAIAGRTILPARRLGR
jgi:hypothetical protein